VRRTSFFITTQKVLHKDVFSFHRKRLVFLWTIISREFGIRITPSAALEKQEKTKENKKK